MKGDMYPQLHICKTKQFEVSKVIIKQTCIVVTCIISHKTCLYKYLSLWENSNNMIIYSSIEKN